MSETPPDALGVCLCQFGSPQEGCTVCATDPPSPAEGDVLAAAERVQADLAHLRREIRAQAREGGLPAPHEREHADRPAWAYDEDGYCVDCGKGHWRAHCEWCEIAYLIDLAVAAGDPLYRSGDE